MCYNRLALWLARRAQKSHVWKVPACTSESLRLNNEVFAFVKGRTIILAKRCSVTPLKCLCFVCTPLCAFCHPMNP
jgi:hypothetical protein